MPPALKCPVCLTPLRKYQIRLLCPCRAKIDYKCLLKLLKNKKSNDNHCPKCRGVYTRIERLIRGQTFETYRLVEERGNEGPYCSIELEIDLIE